MALPPPQIIATLKAKRNDIEASIKLYEQKVEQARRDLAHVNATLTIFATNDPADVRAYTDTSRLFRRGELWALCAASLREHGPQDTRELSRRVAEAKAMDASDPVLCKALIHRVVQVLTHQRKRRRLASMEIENEVTAGSITTTMFAQACSTFMSQGEIWLSPTRLWIAVVYGSCRSPSRTVMLRELRSCGLTSECRSPNPIALSTQSTRAIELMAFHDVLS